MRLLIVTCLVMLGCTQDDKAAGMKSDDAKKRLAELGAKFEVVDDGLGVYLFEPVTEEVLDNLVQLRRVRELEFGGDGKPSDEHLLRLGALKELRKFSISRVGNHPGKGLSFVGHLPDLETIHCAPTDAGIECLKSAKALKYLNLCYAPISNRAMQDIGQISTLVRIDLRGVEISGGIDALRNLSHLKELSLEDTRIDDSALIALLTTSNSRDALELLNLAGTNITDNSLKCVSELKHLKMLALSSTKITSKGLRLVTNCSKLERLFVDGVDLGKDEVSAICDLKGLKALWVSRAKLKEADAEQIRRALPKCEINRLSR